MMKSTSLIFFSLIIISSSVFATINVFWKDVIESHPALFALGLMSTMVGGMGGMMYSMISNPAVEQQKIN